MEKEKRHWSEHPIFSGIVVAIFTALFGIICNNAIQHDYVTPQVPPATNIGQQLPVTTVPMETEMPSVETTGQANLPQSTVAPDAWKKNILRSDEIPEGVWNDEVDAYDYPVFGSTYKRRQIGTVTFLDTLKDAPADAWDVSEAMNGTVMAWVEPGRERYDLYIGAEGGVVAGESCADMFMGYIYMNKISFGKAFHTEGTKDMNQMFRGCSSLTKLDLNGFYTGDVQDMNAMFCDCNSLTNLDLSDFDTGDVKDMGYMFYCCTSLKELNLSGFDTAQVRDMSYMFWHCNSLTELDLSSFNTSNVRNMRQMFRYCELLSELELNSFDTSNVQDMTDMFWCCPAGDKWTHLLN